MTASKLDHISVFPGASNDPQHVTRHVKPVGNSLKYRHALRDSAFLSIILYFAYRHVTAASKMTRRKANSIFYGYPEDRAKVAVGTRLAEIRTRQNILGQIVGRPVSDHHRSFHGRRT